MQRKHCEEPLCGLPGYCVDAKHGVYAIRGQTSGPDSYLHVQKSSQVTSDGHLVTTSMCEDNICREATSVASRIGLTVNCEHTQAASAAKMFVRPAELHEEKLEELFPQSADIRNAAARLNEEAVRSATCAVYPLFEDTVFKRYISYSVHTGSKPNYYSLTSRTVVKYDLQEQVWICNCCKGRGCPHKTMTKWFMYENSPSLLAEHEDINDVEEAGEEDISDANEAGEDDTPLQRKYSQLHYPPDTKELKVAMTDYWINNKLVPYDLPGKYLQPSPGRVDNTDFHPVELECPSCRVPLNEATVITLHAVILTKEAMHKGKLIEMGTMARRL
jgi:hypothetical protein